jgi:hypothetical protein
MGVLFVFPTREVNDQAAKVEGKLMLHSMKYVDFSIMSAKLD